MKDNISKSNRSKKQANKVPKYERYQLKTRSNVFAILMATFFILITIIWILTLFGLGLSYYLFQTGHFVWATVIIIFDLVLVRSYIKTKI